MIRYLLMASVALTIVSCKPKVTEQANIEEISSLEYYLDTFLKFDKVPLQHAQFTKQKIQEDKIVFYFSDRHCLDCVIQNLKAIGSTLSQTELAKGDVALVADFASERKLKSIISRYDLQGIKLIMSKTPVVSIREDWPDQPTFLLFRSDTETAHFLYQPTLYSSDFSRFYLNALTANFT